MNNRDAMMVLMAMKDMLTLTDDEPDKRIVMITALIKGIAALKFLEDLDNALKEEVMDKKANSVWGNPEEDSI